MEQPAQPDPTVLARRYGRPSRRRRLLARALVAVLALAGVGYVVWVALAHTRTGVSAALLGYYDLTDRSVTVQIEVVKDADATVVCRLRAQDVDHNTVGAATVELGPPRYGRRSTPAVTIRTRSRPVNGELVRCTAI